MNNLLVYKGISQYNALRVFAEELTAAWRSMGIHVDVVGEDLNSLQNEFTQVLGNSYDAIFSMNGVLSNLSTNDGDLVQNIFHAPFYGYYVDHPYFNYERIRQPLDNYHALCVEDTFARYMREHHKNLKSVTVFPQAGIEGKDSHRPYKERSKNVVFLGTYRGYDQIMQQIDSLDENTKTVMYEMISIAMENPHITLEDALFRVFLQFGFEPSYTELASELSKCGLVDTYLRSFFRENVIRSLVESGIEVDVYGNGWENLFCNHKELLHCHPPVDYREFLDILADAKIAINVLPWAKAGFHDRIACTMLNGAVSVSDSSLYLKRELTDGEEICMYSLEDIRDGGKQLSSIVKELLEDEKRAEQIAANGYAYAKSKHTWYHRAEQFVELVDSSKTNHSVK